MNLNSFFGSRFFRSFLSPFLITTLGFTYLSAVYSQHIDNWVGVLLCLTVSMGFFQVSSEEEGRELIIRRLEGRVSDLKSQLDQLSGRNKVLENYDRVMGAARYLVATPTQKNKNIFAYQGYPLDLDQERSYFDAVRTAIEDESINCYFRVSTLRDESQVDPIIDVLRILCQGEGDAQKRIRFYVSTQAPENFINFITNSTDDSIVAFPDLSDIDDVKGQRCGVLIKDSLIAYSLLGVFNRIRYHDSTIQIPIPLGVPTEKDWAVTKDRLLSLVRRNDKSDGPF